MDFGLSPDQILLKQTIRRWLDTECPTPRVRAIMESDGGHDPRLWEGLAELGVPGLQVPAAHGGSGLELLDVALAAEELGWCCTPGPFLACALATVELETAPATKVAAGRAAIDRPRDAGLVLLAADAYGGARRCLDMTVKYALTREQFGQPIGAFQGVKHQLADLAADLDPALSLWWYAAHAYDHLPERAARHAAIAKAHLTDLYDRAARVATELHGGIGFPWEYDLHLWFRRAVFDRAFLGEATYHRLRAADLAGW